MKPPVLPVLDPRRAEEIRDEILARRPAYLPEWTPGDAGPDAALVRIASRYAEAVLQRLNQAPEKHRMAFFDLLGLTRIPAQAARVPIVFQLSAQAADATLPAGARMAAPPPPESTDQIVFETERAAGLAAARLRQVVSLWPGRDQWIDHSADHAAGLPFHPFKKALLEDTPHAVYIAHDTLLALAGEARVDVRFDLTEPGSEPLTIVWEYWDGEVWRSFKGMRPECAEVKEAKEPSDGTRGLTRSGRFRLESDCAESKKTTVSGIEAHWIRGRLNEPLPPDPAQVLPRVDDVRLSVQISRPLPEKEPEMFLFTGTPVLARSLGSFGLDFGLGDFGIVEAPILGQAPKTPCDKAAVGLEPDKAFFGAEPLDTSKAFYPLGQMPKPGDAFYFASEEILAKPGAEVTVRVCVADPPPLTVTNKTPLIPDLLWEYWNGSRWQDLAVKEADPDVTGDGDKDPVKLLGNGTFRFQVPDDVALSEVNGEEARWIRARLHGGGYGFTATTSFEGPENPPVTNTFTFVIPQPPALTQLRLGYTWEYGPFPAEHVLTHNDFQYLDQTEEAKWPGLTFLPFDVVSGATPALYLGFDKKLPVDRLNLFFDVLEVRGDTRGPEIVWEAWDGFDWQRLSFEDETASLRVPGMVSVIGPEEAAPAARFGTSLYWLRGRLKEDGPPGEPTLLGLFPNAVWASQWQTVTNERLGTTAGVPHQRLAFRQAPVFEGERVEVRELTGPRANVEWRLLAREVLGGGERTLRELEELLGHEGTATEVERGPLRLRRDRAKRVTEAWVAWEPRRNFLRSGPADRHYVLDRTRGRIAWGDGLRGKVPPAGAAVEARRYKTGGGLRGNVALGAVKQVLTGIPGVEKAWNPKPAEGGADAESLESLGPRLPKTLARRGRALTVGDYETLAREASPAVAAARAVPTLDPTGQPRAGWVTLILLPRTDEPRPWPSFGLREKVRRAVEAAIAADVAAAHHVHVTGPDYLAVDVEATVAPVDPSEAGLVEKSARAALERFLHPLLGGPERRGWDPGRGVFLSDVAAELERVSGLDHVHELALLYDGQLQGERLAVPPDRIAVAGTIRVKVVAPEGANR